MIGRKERRERKKARKRLLLFARRLRGGCELLNTVNDWLQAVGELRQIVAVHADVIPLDERRRLEEAMQLPESPLEDLSVACRFLTLEVEKVAAVLVAGSVFASLAAAATLLTIIAGAAAVLYVNLIAVPITVHNQGCQPIFLTTGLSVSDDALQLAGIDLLVAPIVDGGRGTITAPPSTVLLDALAGDRLQVYVSGQAIPIEIGAARDIIVDGRSIMGGRVEWQIGSLPAHEIFVDCR